MKLSDLKPGSRCVVGNCDGLPCRLLEMGLVPGAEVEVTRYAPFGGPVCLRVHQCQLAIRREDASQIEVETPSLTATARRRMQLSESAYVPA